MKTLICQQGEWANERANDLNNLTAMYSEFCCPQQVNVASIASTMHQSEMMRLISFSACREPMHIRASKASGRLS